jgi:hypothetical protein
MSNSFNQEVTASSCGITIACRNGKTLLGCLALCQSKQALSHFLTLLLGSRVYRRFQVDCMNWAGIHHTEVAFSEIHLSIFSISCTCWTDGQTQSLVQREIVLATGIRYLDGGITGNFAKGSIPHIHMATNLAHPYIGVFKQCNALLSSPHHTCLQEFGSLPTPGQYLLYPLSSVFSAALPASA